MRRTNSVSGNSVPVYASLKDGGLLDEATGEGATASGHQRLELPGPDAIDAMDGGPNAGASAGAADVGESTCEHMPKIQVLMERGLEFGAEDVSKDSRWKLIHKEEDGHFRCYSRRYELPDAPGRMTDRIKSTRDVRGVSAEELARLFFSPDKATKMQWDSSLSDVQVLQEYDANTAAVHLAFKRVWPADPREALVCSHIQQIGSKWVVCNMSVTHPLVPAGKPGGAVRANVEIVMICEERLVDPSQPRTRDNLETQLTYQAIVDLGGWAPASIVKVVSTREFPKVLRNIASVAQKTFSNQPV